MSRRSWVGVVVAAAAAMLVVGCGGQPIASGAPAGAASPAPAAPLRIMLTNDDGWSAPGIAAVRESLRRAGHSVVEVAPASDQSGTGAALTLKGGLAVGHPTGDRDVWSVGGRPADAAAVGLRSIMKDAPPDLVISGINSGNNVSAGAIHSGTVGAAMTAVEYGVPAVAVSGPSAQEGDTGPARYAAAADYTARLVGALAARPAGAPILPAGMVLNVNYPKVQPGGRASVVRAVPTTNAPVLDLGYTPGPAGTLVPRPATPPLPRGEDDATVVADGGVALTDLSADPEAPSAGFGVAERMAGLVGP